MSQPTDYIAEAITEAFGERCPDFNEGCHCCRAWAQYDALRKQVSDAVGGWRPIETVEKYARVLVYVPTNNDRMVLEAVASPDGRYSDPTYNEWDEAGATHWMPLPPAPLATLTGGKADA